jgi:predicted ester cyclase
MSAEANKEVVRRYIEEVINQEKFDLIDELFTPEMREKVKSFLMVDNNPFPDGKEIIEDIVAEDNKVMVRLLFTGTHQGEFMGIPATRKRIEITAYGTYYVENAQITWDTICFDWLEALEQLGATIKLPQTT